MSEAKKFDESWYKEIVEKWKGQFARLELAHSTIYKTEYSEPEDADKFIADCKKADDVEKEMIEKIIKLEEEYRSYHTTKWAKEFLEK